MDFLQSMIGNEADYHELISYMMRFKDDVKEKYEEKRNS